MTRKVLKLAYPSFERFQKDFGYIKKGLLFVPMTRPLPLHTMLHVQIHIPGIEEPFATHGEIIKLYDSTNPQGSGAMSGVLLALDGNGQSLIAEIELAVHSREEYRKLQKLEKAEPLNVVDIFPPGKPTAAARPPLKQPPAPPAVDAGETEVEGIALSPELLKHLNGKTSIDFRETVYPVNGETPPFEDPAADQPETSEASKTALTEEDALILEWIRESMGPDASTPDASVLLEPKNMVADILTRFEDYVGRIRHTQSKGEAMVFHKWFLRAVPPLVEAAEWNALRDILRLAGQLTTNKSYFPDLSNPTVNPFVLAFYEYTDALASAYEEAPAEERSVIDDLVDELGYVGVKILSGILHESEKRDARTAAVAALGKKGVQALHWVRLLIDEPEKKWYLYRNGLLILSQVGNPEEDMNRVRPFLAHAHERVREEAFKTALVYNPSDMDTIIIGFLKDPDRNIRERASTALDRIDRLSGKLFDDILDFLLADPPKDLSEAAGYYRSCSRLVQFVTDQDPIPDPNRFESVLIKLVAKFMKIRKWFAILVNSDEYEEIDRVLSMSLDTLKKIDSPKARAFLKTLTPK